MATPIWLTNLKKEGEHDAYAMYIGTGSYFDDNKIYHLKFTVRQGILTLTKPMFMPYVDWDNFLNDWRIINKKAVQSFKKQREELSKKKQIKPVLRFKL